MPIVSQRRRHQKHSLFCLVIAVCCCATRCSRGPAKTPEVGQQAPDFTLRGLSGARSGLRDLQKNGPVVLNFWASWCAPCKAEVPLLNEVHRKFQGKGLTVVGIDVEERSDTVLAFYRKRRIEYPVLLDSDGSVAKRYGLLSYPMTVVVDQQGTILFRELKMLDEQSVRRLELVINKGRWQPAQGDGP